MSQQEKTLHHEVLTRKNMFILTAFLAVLLVAGSFIFGPYVYAIAIVSYAASVVVELLFAKFRNRSIGHSWMVTPLIFALILPPTVPLWLVAVGSSFGTFFGKALFGGEGRNIFNPAIVGALFVTISFPIQMTQSWFNPIIAGSWFSPSEPAVDAISAATPLVTGIIGGDVDYTLMNLLFGYMPGSIGETFRIGILILGIALIILKIADWRIPLFYLGTVFFITLFGYLLAPNDFMNPIYSILVGGVLFGAFFVATDPVTAPIGLKGKMLYGFGLGVFTVLIRHFGTFAEGVTFAIILMNAIAPLIDSWKTTAPKITEQSEVTS